MVKNADGLSRDLIIHPGETLKEALFDRWMTQKELASRVAMTEQHVSRVVRGTTGISGAFAKKLEHVLNIPASFWMNLQKIYDLELLSMPAISGAYRTSKAVAVDEHVAYAWNKLCDAYLEKIQIETRFEKDTLISYIPEIKALLLAKDIAKAILELQLYHHSWQ